MRFQFGSKLSKSIKLLVLVGMAIYWFLLLKLGPTKGIILQNTNTIREIDDHLLVASSVGKNINNNSSYYTTDSVIDDYAEDGTLDNIDGEIITTNNDDDVKNTTTTNLDVAENYDYLPSSLLSSNPPMFRTGRRPKIPLIDLVNTDPNPECDPGKSNKTLVNHTILPLDVTYPPNRKIPNIIHFTTKSRCMTPAFHRNIDKWRMDGYSVFVHDDAAVYRLLNNQSWPEFPHLALAQNCLLKGASTADLWRYLVLWEYGGIYADIDSAPGPLLESRLANNPNQEAFFVVERLGIMSQYYMSGMAYHPYFYLCVTICLERLFIMVNSVGVQNVPITTGPGVVKVAMMRFMANINPNPPNNNYGRIKAGTYIGLANHSIVVAGSKAGSGKFVIRESMKKFKMSGYAAMGMKHFSQIKNRQIKESCHEYLYNQYVLRDDHHHNYNQKA